MGKAFRIACRAVRFLDLWVQGSGSKRLRIVSSFDDSIEAALPSTSTASFSPTSPAHLRGTFEENTQSGALEVEDSSPVDVYQRRSSSRYSCDSRSSRPRSAGIDALTKRFSSLPANNTDTNIPSHPQLRHRSSSPLLGLQQDYSSGLGIHIAEHSNSDLASERLSAAHDHFLGHIGAFLGLHLQSRTSLDLAASTQRSLEACAGLIAIIKEIWMNDVHRSREVAIAIKVMRKKLERLEDAAQKLCKSSHPLEDPALQKPEQGKSLVVAATACVRSAGDCTAKARHLLDQIGDLVIDMERVHQHQLAVWNPSESSKEGSLRSEDGDGAPDGSVAPQAMLSIPEQETEVIDFADNLPRIQPATKHTSELSLFTFPTAPTTRPYSLSSSFTIQPATSFIAPPTPTSLGSPITPNSFLKSPFTMPARKESIGLSTNESMSAYQDSLRNSGGSAASPTSTRATTPDRSMPPQQMDPSLLTSFSSISSMRSAATGASEGSVSDAEILAISYSHELLFNKEGQVMGGTLPALVEKLTSQYSPPDPTFVNTFYLTFRLFTNAVDLAQALISRFHYVGESKTESMPARLRVFNFMKGWLESHWLTEYDSEALNMIQCFAVEVMQPLLPGPGHRLAGLADKASQQNITNTATQLVSPIGKTSVSLGTQYEKENVPNAIMSRNQLNLLRLVHVNMSTCSVVDFDPVEIARQLTQVQSRTFCAIEAEELLNLEWTRNAETAVNVRAMARFATDLANLVADTILSVEEVKKRALIIKQWIKVSKACLELNNYDCLMAIVCSLTSSTIVRLRATWDLVSQKSKTQFDELKTVVDVSRNYAILRQRLQTPKAPCLPFIGIYLTDLTFIDAGNQDTKILPSSDDTVKPVEVVNFDKHVRTAKVISQLQRYQVPYRLQPIMELQTWLESQAARVRASEDCCMQSFWRRSLQLEPRVVDGESEGRSGFRLGHKASKSGINGVFSREKLDFLSTLGFKSEGELKARIAGAS